MGDARRGRAASSDYAVCNHGVYGDRRHAVKPLAWGLSAIATWALLSTTIDATAAPVATGLLLGMTIGQAAAGELGYGIGTVAITSAIDPLDIAAAFLSVAMALAVVMTVAFHFRPHPLKAVAPDPGFVDAI